MGLPDEVVEAVKAAIHCARYDSPHGAREPEPLTDRGDIEYATRLARAAVAALQPWLSAPEGWRPLTEAPRDGTPGDLWVNGKREPNVVYVPAPETIPGWHDVEEHFLVLADDDVVHETFWRLLPAPPPTPRERT